MRFRLVLVFFSFLIIQCSATKSQERSAASQSRTQAADVRDEDSSGFNVVWPDPTTLPPGFDSADTNEDGQDDIWSRDINNGQGTMTGKDTDGNGKIDTWEINQDGDGFPEMVGHDTDEDGNINRSDKDIDDDGTIDGRDFDNNDDGTMDVRIGTNPADPDGDGVYEPFPAKLEDTDGDGQFDDEAVHMDLDGDGQFDDLTINGPIQIVYGDSNGDGQTDATIYEDLNGNGTFDEGDKAGIDLDGDGTIEVPLVLCRGSGQWEQDSDGDGVCDTDDIAPDDAAESTSWDDGWEAGNEATPEDIEFIEGLPVDGP